MACGCGKGLKAAKSALYTYEVTPPGGGEPLTFLTELEAHRFTRRSGGTIRQALPPAQVPATVAS
jgi:hypothetical protein